MQHKKLTEKIFLTFLTFGFILWFGGSILRTAVAYDLFKPSATKLELKNWYPDEIRMQTVYIYGMMAPYTDISFALTLISAISLVFLWKRQIKQHGWLFMSLVLFFLCTPLQLYLIYFDIKLAWAIYYDNVRTFAAYPIQEYFVGRFKSGVINVASGLAFLANLTILIYLVWQPLNRTSTFSASNPGGLENEAK